MSVKTFNDRYAACLLANMNSLVVDYCIRLKVPSTNVCFFILNQTPILPPSSYKNFEIEFIVSRVACLTRNHKELNGRWLTNYPECDFDTAERRLNVRAELDAFFALKYGLCRDDLAFILDPCGLEPSDYPSTTFPGLKKKELKLYGEFRTRRLVLEAFDKLEKYGVEGFDSAPVEANA